MAKATKEVLVVTTFRLPADLHKKLTQLSIADRRSLNTYVVQVLEREASK